MIETITKQSFNGQIIGIKEMKEETVLVVEVNRDFGKIIINVLEKEIPKVNTEDTFEALVNNLEKYLGDCCTILNIFKY